MISTGICRWLFLLISLSTWTKLTDSKEMRVVCYYTNWSVYRPGPAKFSPQNINPYLCTHLVYAFGGFTKENNLKPFDKYQDIEKGGYAKFTGLKTYNKNLKTLIAIGGWNEGSSRFSPMVANADRRKELVKNAVKFLRQNHFDGLDLDWEYPTFRDGGKPRDRDNYAQLVKELREEFDRESEKTGRPRLLLTMAVPAGIEYINKGYDVPKLMKSLDWMNILSYDYHSAFEPSVNHHAPLYPLEEENEYNYDTELNIDYTIKHYLKHGADPSKLVLGIPTYGRSYTLFNPDASEIGAPADGPGDMGEYTRENGYLAYYEICEYVKEQDWEVVQPNPDAMGPFAVKDNQWVGYDDEDIVRKKAEYVVEKGLGGIMFWAIDNDDFRGSCHGRPYPLIEAAKEAMINAYGITDENLISPPSKPTKTKSKTRTRLSLKTSTNDDEEKSVRTKTTNSNSPARRRRIQNKTRKEETTTERQTRRKLNKDSRKQETSSYSSLSVITPAYTTPEPPSTPDQGGAFKCEDEGFFPHPKDCKKYFWCLSGAGDSGIIAHQFTCPAGLYFNKAADSCDYTQNVLCNKKLQKPTTTTTTTTESSAPEKKSTTAKKSLINTSLFSSTRAPPKITAATSRTTFKQTTTTEKYEEDEEYEYDDDEAEDDQKSEEDPKVIKELIDLIRKAGGIEELEKHLSFGGKGGSSNGPDSTTQTAISKSLYERVLAKTGKNALDALKKTSVASRNRNSGGPQNNGLENDEKSSSRDRSRPQYQTITRNRPSTEKSVQGNEEEAEASQSKEKSQRSSLFKTKSTPEYVSIRRGRVSTTPEPEDDRNKILGETSDQDEYEDEEDDEEAEDLNKRKSTTPKYVSIRRQRPSTTEGPSTSKYVELRRRPTTSSTMAPEEEAENSSKRYQTIRRGTTTLSPDDSSVSTAKSVTTTVAQINQNTSPKYISIRRGTTTTSTRGYDENEVTEKSLATEKITTSSTAESISTTNSENATNASSPLGVTEINIANVPGASSIESQTVTSVKPDDASDSQIKNLVETTEIALESEITTEKKPLLLGPRPFSTRPSITITNTEQPTKVSLSNLKSRVRPKVSEGAQTTEPVTVRPRTRGLSRFSVRNKNTNSEEKANENNSTSTPAVRKRRPSTLTTEKHVDYNEELERTYRPSELADLSSLTAVDVNVRGNNLISGNQRRRRPAVTTTSSTTERTEESTKSSLRSLPLARKLAERNKKTNDLVNSSSESKFPTRLRGFRATTENNTQNVETTTNDALARSTREGANEVSSPRTRKIIRRFRPTSTAKTTTVSTNNIETTTPQPTLRRRTLFRNKQNSTEAQTENPLQEVSNKKPARLPFDNQEEKEDLAVSLEEISEEGENIKLSESNIRENSDVNSFDTSGKTRRKFVKLIPKSKSDSLYVKSYNEDKSTSRKEIIEATTTATSSTSKPSITTTMPTEEVDLKKSEINNNETTTEKAKEPNVIRRRKVIRKFKPTESTPADKLSENKDLNVSKRKRKVIRRLRPVPQTNTLNLKEDEKLKASEQSKPRFYIRGRSTSTTTTTTSTESAAKASELPVPQRLYRPNLSQRRNRFDKTETEHKNEDDKETDLMELRLHNVSSDVLDSSTLASTIAYSLYERKKITPEEEQKLSASTPSSRLKVYTRATATTESKKPESEQVSSTPRYSYYARSTTERDDEDEDKLHNFSRDDDKESDMESFMSTPGYSYYARPSSERDHDDEEDDDDEFESDEDDEDQSMDSEEPHEEEPKYVSFSRTTTTKKSHHFVSSINFNDENEQDKDDSVKENMSLNSTIVKSLKNIHNISTLTMPSPEGGTENPNIVNDETSTGSEKLSPQTNTDGSLHVEKTSTLAPSVLIEATEISNEIIESTASTSDNEIAQSNTPSRTETTILDESTTLKEYTTQSTATIQDSNISSSTTITTTVEPQTEIQNVTDASTEYHRISTLRSIKGRPKYNVPKRLQTSTADSTTSTTTTTTTEQNTEATQKPRVNSNKFNRSRFQKSTTPKTPSKSKVRVSSPLPINRNIYRYSTTERTRHVTAEEEESIEDFEDEPNVETEYEHGAEEEHVQTIEKSAFIKPLFTQKSTTESSHRKINFPVKPQIGRPPNKLVTKPKPSTRTTTTESPKEDDLRVDTEAIKNRNKNLFSKRKMNTPFVASTATTNLEPVTKSTPEQTTETLTTLHHVFAEVGESGSTDNFETTTESLSSTSATSSKVEKLIEVNRIIEVYSKEDKVKNHTGLVEGETKVQVIPTVDKIGAVNRVTIIKVVDGNNVTIVKEDSKQEHEKDISTTTTTASTTISPTASTTTFVPLISLNGDIVEVAKVEEVPAPAVVNKVNLTNISLNVKMQNNEDGVNREDRKFDIINIQGKVSGNSLSDSFSKPQIIDGTSHINIVTPKVYGTAASTIPLQGLFQTEPSTTNHLNPSFSSNDELLETEHSKYVDIRVLKQDDDTKMKKASRDNSKILPVKILEQDDEEVTLKARVVEVTPRPNSNTIRIVPIQVEMSRKLTENLPIYRVQKK